MNEEPPTPLYPGFMEWHGRQYRSHARHHRFVGSMEGADMYVYEGKEYDGSWELSGLVAYGDWARNDWGGFTTMEEFRKHQGLSDVRERLTPAAELLVKLICLHQ